MKISFVLKEDIFTDNLMELAKQLMQRYPVSTVSVRDGYLLLNAPDKAWDGSGDADLFLSLRTKGFIKDWTIEHTISVRVQDEVAYWNAQIAENALWSEKEQKIILQTIALIQGKNKKDALASLRERINKLDGLSVEATFARSVKRHLEQGK